MKTKAEEISSIIKEQIKNYDDRIEMRETGKVMTVGDGIARVYGLRNCMANELLEFADGSFGVLLRTLKARLFRLRFYLIMTVFPRARR